MFFFSWLKLEYFRLPAFCHEEQGSKKSSIFGIINRDAVVAGINEDLRMHVCQKKSSEIGKTNISGSYSILYQILYHYFCHIVDRGSNGDQL